MTEDDHGRPGPGDLQTPFLFVPHGDPLPLDWMARHPGWVKFPATMVPRRPAARTGTGTQARARPAGSYQRPLEWYQRPFEVTDKARLRLCLKLRQRLAFGIPYLRKAGPGAACPWRVWAEPSLAC